MPTCVFIMLNLRLHHALTEACLLKNGQAHLALKRVVWSSTDDTYFTNVCRGCSKASPPDANQRLNFIASPKQPVHSALTRRLGVSQRLL